MIVTPNEIKSVIYHENYNQLVIDVISSDNPINIVINKVRNFTQALQILENLKIPISMIENIEDHY